jgi:NADPH:quinone reductase-like Zn-dependent oxidoreductase
VRAVIFNEYGGTDVLRLADMPFPEISPADVLVRVRACGVNRLDLLIRSGKAGKVSLPHIPGSEVVGEIAVLGDSVQGYQVGQAVAVYPYFHCGRCSFCLSAQENICPRGGLVGISYQGGYAQYIRVPVRCLVPLPEGLFFEDAAAVTLSMLTAWHMLISRAGLSPGEWVLVLGAAGGVGSAAIQVASLTGAKVIAAGSSHIKLAQAAELGADEVINYLEEDFVAAVERLTDGCGVDVVVEHIGADTWLGSLRCLARGGRIVTCGATTGNKVQMDINYLFNRQNSIIGSRGGTKGELSYILELVAQGRLVAVVDEIYPLSEVVTVQERLEKRDVFGKLILVP